MATKAKGYRPTPPNSAAQNCEELRGRPFAAGEDPRRNKGGRPKDLGKFREMVREHTPKALRALLRSLKDKDYRVSAAKVLLEFGWGKPSQQVQLTGAGDGPIKVEGFDAKELSDEQLDQLTALIARGVAPGSASSDPH